MMIRVRYVDNTDGRVEAAELEKLIAAGDIMAFKRASGWARLGVDPVRSPRVERWRPKGLVNYYV